MSEQRTPRDVEPVPVQVATGTTCTSSTACGHGRLAGFSVDDLTTFDRDTARLTGVTYGGATAP